MIRAIVRLAVLYGAMWPVASAGFGASSDTPGRGDEAEFRFSRKLDLSALPQEELVAATLDSDVYSATEPGLPDIRIFDGAGNEMSYLLRKATTTRGETVRQSWRAKDPVVRPLEGGGLEIIVALDKDDPQPGGLRIVSPLRNFENRVQVFASTDGRDWRPIAEDGLIFDYSQYMDVRNDSVVAEGRPTDRRFRIVIDDVTAEQQSELMELSRRLRGDQESELEERFLIERRPFRIDRIEFWRDERVDRTTGEKNVHYPLTIDRVENDSEEQQTFVYLHSGREPLTGMKLNTPTRNFSRQARVQVERTKANSLEPRPDSERQWQTIGQRTISRLDFRDLDREELSVSFPESRETQYRLVIDNRNSAPLVVDGIEAEGHVYQVVFLADPGTDYSLAYGDAEAAAPDYDVAAIRASLAAGYDPVMATLALPVESRAAPAATGWTLLGVVNDPWLLGGVIVVLVAALGWGLYQASRRLETTTDE